jgi:hypothetical protein
LVGFDAQFDGMINGEPIAAGGSGSFDASGEGSSFGSIDFDSVPSGFTPIAANAMLTNICPNGFLADGDSMNLWELTGGSYSIDRTFGWIGFDGFMSASADVVMQEGGQSISSSMTFEGTYAGPTDLVGIDSYSILWLPGSLPGEMFEAGTAVMRRANGEIVVTQFATHYTGMANSLLEPQYGEGFLDVTWDGQTLDLGWTGVFQVPTPSSAGLLAAAGVMASRRRRSS